MDLKKFEREIEVALKAAQDASEAILEIYNSSDFDVELKSDNSPLTRADRASHEIIEKGLKQTGIPVLSEEGKDIPFSERSNWEYFWLVDPLDGTKEFIKRNGEFTVNIALMHKTIPVWGVVSAPALEKLYYLDTSGFVWLKDKNGKSLLQRRSGINLETEGLRIVASRSHSDKETLAFISALNNPVLVNMGSSLKFMALAEGMADVYPRFSPTMEWDTAAAHSILKSLGINITEQVKSSEMEYNKENLLNPSFIAGKIN